MLELHNKPEVAEGQKTDITNFREIKPERDTSISDARSFVDSLFKEPYDSPDGYYNSYEDRVKYTPSENSNRGEWTGERGESKFIPSEETDEGKAAKEKLAELGKDGVDYEYAEPDFSECAEATVEIGDMTENRHDYQDAGGNYRSGNFSQADAKCAEQWNTSQKDGKSDWTAADVRDWRRENKCSWHERCDTKTMDLVPREIHEFFKHSGGVAECKARDSANIGGEFDE